MSSVCFRNEIIKTNQGHCFYPILKCLLILSHLIVKYFFDTLEIKLL